MGQKVNPHGLRVGVIKGWNAKWYAEKKDFAGNLVEDFNIRKSLKKDYYDKCISKIIIERAAQKLIITMYTLKPAALIGNKGSEIEVIRKKVKKIIQKDNVQVVINVMEIKNADLDAQMVAENIAAQLERRISFRKAMKQALQRTMKSRAKGIKVMVSGRLDGAEIARSEHYSEGSIPLQTLRADIDYGFAEAHTTFGVLGVKAWIYKGEVLGGRDAGGEHNVNA